MTNKHYYTEHHLWVVANPDGSLNVGISDHAQQMLGDIVFVDAPPTGTKLHQGQSCGIVESVKTASDLHAPVDGEVLSINDQLANNPELLNDAPEETWIFSMRPDSPDLVSTLMDKAAYENMLA